MLLPTGAQAINNLKLERLKYAKNENLAQGATPQDSSRASPLPLAPRVSIGSPVSGWQERLDARVLGGWVAWSRRPQRMEPVGIWYPRKPQSSDLVSILMVPKLQ